VKRFLVLFVVVSLLLPAASAIDINDTDSLDYWSDNSLDFRVEPDGDVLVPGGDLNVSGKAGVGDPGGGDSDIEFHDDGSGVERTLRWDNSNNYFVLEQDDGSLERITTEGTDSDTNTQLDDETPMSNVDMDGFSVENVDSLGNTSSGRTLEFDSSQNVNIPNGNLTMNSNWIRSVHDPSSSQDAMTKGFADSAYLNRDGTDSMSGDLDMSGYNIKNVDALGNGTTRTVEMTTGGNVNIPNGNLNISQKEGSNFLRLTDETNSNIWDHYIQTDADYVMQKEGDGIISLNSEDNRVSILSGNLGLAEGTISNITDGTNDIVKFDGSQNVEIPNGNLSVSSPSSRTGELNVGGNIDTAGNDVNNVKTVSFESAGSVSGSSGDICIGDRC